MLHAANQKLTNRLQQCPLIPGEATDVTSSAAPLKGSKQTCWVCEAAANTPFVCSSSSHIATSAHYWPTHFSQRAAAGCQVGAWGLFWGGYSRGCPLVNGTWQSELRSGRGAAGSLSRPTDDPKYGFVASSGDSSVFVILVACQQCSRSVSPWESHAPRVGLTWVANPREAALRYSVASLV